MPEGTDPQRPATSRNSDPQLAAESELAQARLALDQSDLQHAADHVASALALAPALPAVHEALAQVAARAGQDALDLFGMDGRVFVGTVAARAHLMAARGQVDDAIDLLARATRHAPTLPWANVAWVADPGLVERLDPDQLFRSLIAVVGGAPDPVPDELVEPLRAYLDLAERAVAAYPHHAVLLGVCSALARKMGRLDRALAWAGRAVAEQPSTMTEMWLGYAQQRAGRTDDAVASLRRAMAHDPMNFSLHADAANWLAEAGRVTEGLRVAEEALKVDPDHDCVFQVASRLRFELDGDVAHLIAIADYVRSHPDQPHEHTDLASGCGTHAWLGQIPSPSEASVNAVRKVLASGVLSTGDDAGHDTLRLSDLEPPSALMLVARVLPGVAVTVENVRAPDIREPRRPDGITLWHYDGTTVSPAVAPPSAIAAATMLRVADPRLVQPVDAYDTAVVLSSLSTDDLIALLVHPPEPPDNELGRWMATTDPAWWVKSVQVWACLGLLHHQTREPWLTSSRRRLLLELAWGVEDWTTEAAMFALVAAGWADPTIRADVASLVAERIYDLAKVCRRRAVTIAWSLATLALSTPDLPAQARSIALAIAEANSSFVDDVEPEDLQPAPPIPSTTDAPSVPATTPAAASTPDARSASAMAQRTTAEYPIVPPQYSGRRRWTGRHRH